MVITLGSVATVANEPIYGPYMAVVLYPDPSRKNREGVWQHAIHCRIHVHCTVQANQVTECKYIMLINKVLTKQWHLDHAGP